MRLFCFSFFGLKTCLVTFTQSNAKLFMCCALMFVLAGCGNKPEDDFNNTAVRVNTNQMLFVCNENGASLIDFTEIKGCSAQYRWRSWSKGHTSELSGFGTAVQEERPLIKVGNTSFSTSTNMVFDIIAGYVKLPWTPGSSNTVKLYYSPQKTSVKLLPDKEFENFKPSEIVSE